MKEMLDVLDSEMHIIGVKDRVEVHRKGLWHQTFHCWIVKSGKDEQFVVVQKRDKHKKVAPNYLDITAAGHLLSGETPMDGIRELREELGIEIDEGRIVSLGVRISASERGDQINKEFCHVYFLQSDLPLSDYKLQQDEVSGLVEIQIKEGMKLFTGEVDRIRCRSLFIDHGKKTEALIDVRVADFIPRIEPYYLKVFIMAERFFEGRKGLAI